MHVFRGKSVILHPTTTLIRNVMKKQIIIALCAMALSANTAMAQKPSDHNFEVAKQLDILNHVYKNLDLLYVGAIYLLPTTAENLKTDVYTTVMSHVMQRGETAYDIITGYGVDYYKNLAKLESYNGGKDLAKISAGEKLLIPLV